MINLLPPQQKKEVLEEERRKLFLISGFFFSVFLVSLTLALLSVKIYISGQVLSQKILAEEAEKKFRASEAKTFEEEIRSLNDNLLKLKSFYDSQPNLTGLLEKIPETLPQKTYLTNLSLYPASQGNHKLFQVSLTGYSATRDDLLAFKKNLESEPGFSEIYFPPQSWVKSKDIDFSVSFKAGL